MTNALEKAVEICGGQNGLAREISVGQGHVWHWLKKSTKGVPAEYCAAIERATNGYVTRSDLRPDIWPPSDPLPPVSHTRGAGA